MRTRTVPAGVWILILLALLLGLWFIGRTLLVLRILVSLTRLILPVLLLGALIYLIAKSAKRGTP